ncbi:MAG: hypothetical protein Q9M18_03005 [Mariprofundaceae bacterium]|nr:hypothetical protein [Mariprofundaceae bacterium]
MFPYSLALMLLCLPLSTWASDVDMQHLNQLLQLSNQLSEQQVLETAKHDTSLQQDVLLHDVVPPHRVLIDIRSTHSDGEHDMPTLIALAEKRGIESMAFTEHDRFSIRFGIDPMPQWLGYSQQHPSLYTTGLGPFFDDLQAQRRQHPDIQLFAGTESIAGYHWTGIPFQNLALHNVERHMIALGIEKPEQVKALTSYDLRYGLGNRSISLSFWCALMFIMVMFFLLKRKRAMALLLVASMTAFLATWLLKPKVDVDAAWIESAKHQRLFTIWTHPGTLSGVREGSMGVQLDTPPYSRRVFKEPTADAFTAVYGDNDLNTLAGGLWDRYLMDYMHGYHAKPIWAVAAGDFHGEGQSGEYLGNFPMDVWSQDAKAEHVLDALHAGHMVAWGMGQHDNIAVKALFLKDAEGQSLQVGDEARVKSPVQLVIALQERIKSPSSVKRLQGQWIVDGHTVNKVSLDVMGNAVMSALVLEKGVHVIRFQIQQGIRLVANPFLVHVE